MAFVVGVGVAAFAAVVDGDGGEDAGGLCNPGWAMDSRVAGVGKCIALAQLPAVRTMVVEEFAHADCRSLEEEMLGAVVLRWNPTGDHH